MSCERHWVSYFNDLSVWSKAHGTSALRACPNPLFASLKMKKWSARPGAWSKWVLPILLMSNRCFLGVTCNKPIRVSSPIPFQSELRLLRGGLLRHTDWTRLQRANRSAHAQANRCQFWYKRWPSNMTCMTILYLCSLHNNIILHCIPFIFYIWHVCVLPCE